MSSSTIPPSRREEILAPRREQLLEWLPARDMSKAAARLWVLDFHDEVWVRGGLLRFVILLNDRSPSFSLNWPRKGSLRVLIPLSGASSPIFAIAFLT